jgi:DNA polymerase-3 subunit gamma/tau
MTTESLSLRYRPTTFQDVVGQKVNAIVLSKMVEEGSVPQGLLFAGPKGSGKTSMARILANALDAGEPIEVDAASNGLVADVRTMIDSLRYSAGTEYRVIILDEAHSMTKEAFNALLKTLEEPPAGTIFILVTTEPEKIPETVKSRLMEFTFRKVSPALIQERLYKVIQAEGITHSDDLVKYIAERADGSVRDALMMLDQCWRANISDKETFLEMNGEEDVAPDLILAMLTGDHSHIYEVADELAQRVPDPSKLVSGLTQTLRDVLILKSGGTLSLTKEGMEKRKNISLYLEPERIVAAMRMMWDLRTRVRESSDPRANLDLLLVLVTDIFTQGRKAPVQVARKRLTIEDL